MTAHLDAATLGTLLITLVLFGIALFVKGFGHDLLLEAAVFLVSIKLVQMTYKLGVQTESLVSRLDALKSGVDRIEDTLRRRGSIG
jgi:hypothetical protein